MLYRNILKHEAGFDYEFEEGTVVNITHLFVDTDGDLNFYLNNEPACATVEEFEANWAPIVDNDSVKNLQKEWAKRIEEDKRFLPDDEYATAKIFIERLYDLFEDFYSIAYGYKLHEMCEELKDCKQTTDYLNTIYKDFLQLWEAQHR